MVQVTEVIQGKPDDEIDAAVGDALSAETGEDVKIADGEDAERSGGDTLEAGAAETLVVTIGDTPPAEEDENLNFKQLRENRREIARQLKEANRKLAALEGAKQADATLGTKPKLEDFSYDQDKYDEALEAYVLKKAEVAAADRAKQEAQQRAEAAWNEKLNGYGKAKTDFKARAPDFDEAEAEVQGALSAVQQGIMVKCAKDAPLLVYALHKNPAKLKELSAMTDPVEFTWAVAQTEAQLKVSTKQERQEPEARVGGTVSTKRGADAHLEKLQAEAYRTGDVTKVHAYKKQLREKSQKAA